MPTKVKLCNRLTHRFEFLPQFVGTKIFHANRNTDVSLSRSLSCPCRVHVTSLVSLFRFPIREYFCDISFHRDMEKIEFLIKRHLINVKSTQSQSTYAESGSEQASSTPPPTEEKQKKKKRES